MSFQTVQRVFDNPPAKTGDLTVLLYLAHRADKDHTNAYPGIQTIADATNLSLRGAKSSLKRLRECGAITKTGRSQYGTAIYEVTAATAVNESAFGVRVGCTSEQAEVHTGAQMASRNSPNQSVNQSEDQQRKESRLETSVSSCQSLSSSIETSVPGFEDFWHEYPDKKDDHEERVRCAWDAAVRKGAEPAEIIDGLRRYLAFVADKHEGGFKQAYKGPYKWLSGAFWKSAYRIGPDPADELLAMRIEKDRRRISADERAAALKAAKYPYDAKSNAVYAAVKGAAS